jgi:hypothetical protein
MVCGAALVMATGRMGAAAPVAPGKTGASLSVKAAPAPLRSLSPFPATIRFSSREDSQQLVISGLSGPGDERDFTGAAAYQVSNPRVVSVSRGGVVTPVGDGKAVVTVTVQKLQAKVPVTVAGSRKDEPASFVHDVEPALSRAGCNQGGCHGKATGQNGFRLSLFGFDPQFDYDAIVKEGRGRRLAPDRPEESLLLLKATATLPHGGGKRFERASSGYRLLTRWIAQGMPYTQEARPTLDGLSVAPSERLMGAGRTQQLAVTARFSDGSTRDVTRDCLFRSNEEGLATVDEGGRVAAGKNPGEAAIMASYMGQVTVFRAAVPLGAPASAFGAFPANNYIDALVSKKLQRLGVPPSPLCADEEFIRRVSLDLCGRLPKPDETRAFLAECEGERGTGGSGKSPSPQAPTPNPEPRTPNPVPAPRPQTLAPAPKARQRLVDRLLDDPDYASFFALKWSGILRNTGQYRAGAYAFHAWLRESIAANKPYDQFVRDIVAAQGEWEEHPPSSWFWQFRDGGVPELVGDVSQLFLGLRIQCAKCHHHPYEKWSQDDYYGLAGFFTRMGRKILKEPGYYYAARRVTDGLNNPRTGKAVSPKLLGGPELAVKPGEDPRQKLVDWMSEPSNPFFAPTIVNRMWAHFMGRGLVEPIDDMRVTNPPSNPELLQAMSRDLIEHKFDLKGLIRAIVNSRTYQLSSTPNRYNAPDRQNYARHYPKRLMAEVFLDAVDQVTGVKTSWSGVSAQARAINLPHEEFPSYFLDVFGRPKQLSSPCECARESGANLSQVLHLVNSSELDNKIADGNGRAAALAKSDRPLKEKIEELYLWAFCRLPDADELKKASDFVSGEKEQKAAFEELIWTFINCREFQFNH